MGGALDKALKEHLAGPVPIVAGVVDLTATKLIFQLALERIERLEGQKNLLHEARLSVARYQRALSNLENNDEIVRRAFSEIANTIGWSSQELEEHELRYGGAVEESQASRSDHAAGNDAKSMRARK